MITNGLFFFRCNHSLKATIFASPLTCLLTIYRTRSRFSAIASSASFTLAKTKFSSKSIICLFLFLLVLLSQNMCCFWKLENLQHNFTGSFCALNGNGIFIHQQPEKSLILIKLFFFFLFCFFLTLFLSFVKQQKKRKKKEENLFFF